jgi:hypothetical protein
VSAENNCFFFVFRKHTGFVFKVLFLDNVSNTVGSMAILADPNPWLLLQSPCWQDAIFGDPVYQVVSCYPFWVYPSQIGSHCRNPIKSPLNPIKSRSPNWMVAKSYTSW